MIVKARQGEIFNTEFNHIAFPINCEGYNDSGFSGYIARTCWRELLNCGEHKLGTVLSKYINGKTYHALVCNSMINGWDINQDEIIKECFDNIQSNGEMIATIAMGNGAVANLNGANFNKIVCGMHESNKMIVMYSVLPYESLIDIYNESKQKVKKYGVEK